MQKAAEKRLSEAISGPAISLLDSAPADLWPRLERLYQSALKQAQSATDAGLLTSSQVAYLSNSVCGKLPPCGALLYRVLCKAPGLRAVTV